MLKDEEDWREGPSYTAGPAGGLNHEAWLEKKAEDKEKELERLKLMNFGANIDLESPVKKNNFIHNLNFDDWTEKKKQ